MLHTFSIIAPGVTMVVSCLLPAKATARSSGISKQACVRDRNVWESGKRWKRGRRDITAGKAWWQAGGGDVLDDGGSAALRDWRPWTALFGAGAPWKGCNWGLPLLQHRVRCKEQNAEAIMPWPSGSSPPNTSLKDLGGMEQNIHEKWRNAELRRGEQRYLTEAEAG